MSVESVRRYPVRCCLSGPAAGVVGAAEVARGAGYANLITFDAGGTSTDVSLIERGVPAFASARTIADYPVRSPMVDVHVIGAGGGSIAWLDDAGALKVGPRSAGADPGPVAYGRGGIEPTLTDANIVLHRLDPMALLGGRMLVDAGASRRAVAERIAAPMGLSVEQAALGIIRIAVANMSRAIRSVFTEKGHDVREFALFPYGGAGPLHAAAVAAECGIRRVLVPIEPGTMCARGILLSDVSLDLVRSEITPAEERNWSRIPARAIEVVNCRLKAIGLIERPTPHFIGAVGAPQAKATRDVHFDTGWVATPMFDRADLAIGTGLSGPAVVDEMSATTLVPPGCAISVDGSGNLLMEVGT